MSFENSSEYEPFPFTEASRIKMETNVEYHSLNVLFGAICFVVNIPLFLIFVTSKTLRNRSQVLIALNVADAVNCLSIMFMGLNRVWLYSSILESGYALIRTQWECATEPWIFLRVIGDLWAPILQFGMGFERVLAVFKPVLYMGLSKNRAKLIITPSVVFVVCSIFVGFFLSYMNRFEVAKYYCGRKASFGTEYGIFIYATNIVGYFMGLLFNVVALVKATAGMSKEGRRQFRKIRYTLSISLLSTILVSVPNGTSFISAVWIDIADWISKPATYLTCINSGLNMFVYFALNEEFRHRVLVICRISKAGSSTMMVTRIHSTT